MTRSVRLLIVGLLSAMLTLGMTAATSSVASADTNRAAPTPDCIASQQQDAAAASDVAAKSNKFKKAKKKYRKAVKLNKKKPTVKHQKAVKKAKKKKNRAKTALRAATVRRVTTSNQFVVFCGSTPSGGTVPAGTSTPGTSPLAPLCNQVPQLQPLCDATTAAGNTSPLAPLCAAIPQLAPLCAVNPGDLANPAQLNALLDLLKANLPQGISLVTFLQQLLTRLVAGDLAGVAATLGTTPQVLITLLNALASSSPVPIPVP